MQHFKVKWVCDDFKHPPPPPPHLPTEFTATAAADYLSDVVVCWADEDEMAVAARPKTPPPGAPAQPGLRCPISVP